MEGAWMLLLMGLAFSAVGWGMLVYEYRFFKRAIKINGVCTSYASQHGSKGGTTYAPVVSFEFDGEQRQATGTIYSSAKPTIGKLYVVGIDPQHIEKARVYSKCNYMFFGIFALIGTGLLVGYVLSLLR